MSKFVSEMFANGEAFEQFLWDQIHTNKALLDTITQTLVNEWNAKATAIKVEGGKLKLLDKNNNVLDEETIGIEDGNTIVRNVSGALEVHGIKEINGNRTIKLWVGTQAQYNALSGTSDDVKYWITDDNTLSNIQTTLADLVGRVSALEDGTRAAALATKASSDLDGNLIKKNYSFLGQRTEANGRLLRATSEKPINLDEFYLPSMCGNYTLLASDKAYISGLPTLPSKAETINLDVICDDSPTLPLTPTFTTIHQTLRVRCFVHVSGKIDTKINIYHRSYTKCKENATGNVIDYRWSAWARTASAEELEDGSLTVKKADVARVAQCDDIGQNIRDTYARKDETAASIETSFKSANTNAQTKITELSTSLSNGTLIPRRASEAGVLNPTTLNSLPQSTNIQLGDNDIVPLGIYCGRVKVWGRWSSFILYWNGEEIDSNMMYTKDENDYWARYCIKFYESNGKVYAKYENLSVDNMYTNPSSMTMEISVIATL